VMEDTDGTQHIVTGEYREVVDNERLAFTWQWEGSEVVTFVEVDFRAIDADNTELSVVHTLFETEEQRDLHGQGWGACLEKLQNLTES
ncbi:MAG: SRPBCC domain-containing protein, partial [Gammaproteobacteria bacterium]|nr:SRPBCC domain-containing protein [Gammaproteobacteria bacterium]